MERKVESCIRESASYAKWCLQYIINSADLKEGWKPCSPIIIRKVWTPNHTPLYEASQVLCRSRPNDSETNK